MAMEKARDVLVIGGSRYFGKRLIARLLAAGDRVTVLNRGSSAPPAGVVHLTADRDDEDALRAALGPRTFDVVVDQVCYTPRQAVIARRVFTGRTRLYVMTSTVEVYEHEDSPTLVSETAVDPLAVVVDLELPWDDPEFLDTHYGEGKRQAEAVFAAAGPEFPYTAVRVAHVLGGADDFTGRLAHYADRIRTGEPIAVPATNHPATYIHVDEIADFLFWTALPGLHRPGQRGLPRPADHGGPVRGARRTPAVGQDGLPDGGGGRDLPVLLRPFLRHGQLPGGEARFRFRRRTAVASAGGRRDPGKGQLTCGTAHLATYA